jgi:hypothetical protein
MGFDKHYPNRKDWRKPYRGSRAVDRSCRPGGGCPWCERARKHADERRAGPVVEDEQESRRSPT